MHACLQIRLMVDGYCFATVEDGKYCGEYFAAEGLRHFTLWRLS